VGDWGGSRRLWVVGVSGQLSLLVPVLCCCSWVRGMGAPCFSCVVVPVSCRCLLVVGVSTPRRWWAFVGYGWFRLWAARVLS